jgi:O-antigen/teichoic acid export membrane protein
LSNKRISRNIVATVTQVLISGVVFFILYRYLYDWLGVEQIGVWSLVLAATSVSRIGDLGLSAGVVRFVAQALGRGDTARAADVVQTISLTLGTCMAALLSIGYPLLVLALNYLIPAHSVPIALSILPYAVVSLWVMVVVNVFSGGLDGCMRMDLRSLLMGLSHLAYLGLAMWLVPQYGLEGVAIAQLIQSVGLMTLMWWVLRWQMKELPLLPLHWKPAVLREMIGYGVNFQIITVMNMLFDPMVKALMSKFGGLEALGYYEMANRLILQGRALIIEASRVMVPAVAALQDHDAGKAKQLFITSYQLTFYVAVLFYGVLGALLSTISIFWLGHYQPLFVQFALLLNFAWFANTLVGPAYFANLGSGKLWANMISHVVILLCSLVVGVSLGLNYGGLGVAVGTVIGLIAGSLLLQVLHVKQIDLNLVAFIIPQNMIKVFIVGIFAIFLSNYGIDQQSSFAMVSFVALVCSCIFLAFSLNHPNRKVLMSFR